MGNRRNVNKMMQQVQQMQQQMQQAQEELANETVTASAGGGAVKATMTGGMELVSIEIDPEVVDPEDIEGSYFGGGGYQGRWRVYDREGEPCPKCGEPIQRVSRAGRSTYFCPRCQRDRRRGVSLA